MRVQLTVELVLTYMMKCGPCPLAPVPWYEEWHQLTTHLAEKCGFQ